MYILHNGINDSYDKYMLKWLYSNYENKNIANYIKLRISGFLGTIELKEDSSKMKRLDYIEKAISQDFKKMLLSAKKIYDHSIECEETSHFMIGLYDEKRDSLQINMEYFIYKYRVIVEYVMKILNEIVYMDKEKYKEEKSIKFLKEHEITNQKIKYISKLVKKYSKKNLDLEWFDKIRRVRNQLTHEGASCMIFENENEPLFQIYDLEVNDLLIPDEFLSNGNVISCKYFIAVTVSYLTYFIDTIFQLLNGIDDNEKFEWNKCRLNYRVIDDDYKEQLGIIDEICGISRDIPIYQECLFKLVKQYMG